LGLPTKKEFSKIIYLISIDDRNDISISRKLQDGNFIGRIEKVKQYAFVNDSLLFARCVDDSGKSVYYILNTRNDSEFAEVKNAVTGPIDSADFINGWVKKFNNIKFISVAN
jgi:hypothetical protein